MALSQPGRGSEEDRHRVLFLALSYSTFFSSVVDGNTEVVFVSFLTAQRWDGLLI